MPSPASPSPGLNALVITPTNPRAYSGIYPHTAVTSTHYEVGIGSIVRRGDKLYYATYGPHLVTGGSDKLYMVDMTDLSQTTYLDYPGNTDANRYVGYLPPVGHRGAAYIDATRCDPFSAGHEARRSPRANHRHGGASDQP